jgi:hypothetical protein
MNHSKSSPVSILRLTRNFAILMTPAVLTVFLVALVHSVRRSEDWPLVLGELIAFLSLCVAYYALFRLAQVLDSQAGLSHLERKLPALIAIAIACGYCFCIFHVFIL